MTMLRSVTWCLWSSAAILALTSKASVSAFMVPPTTTTTVPSPAVPSCSSTTAVFFRSSAEKSENLSENVSHRQIRKQLARPTQQQVQPQQQQQQQVQQQQPPRRSSSGKPQPLTSMQQRIAQPSPYTQSRQPTIRKTAKQQPQQQGLVTQQQQQQQVTRPKETPPAINTAAMATTPLSRLMDLRPEYQLVTPSADVLALQEGQRLVCMGDVHGDYNALVEFLDTAGVIHRQRPKEWIGGNTILVQCGDILDRGTQELACYQLLATLSQQAPSHDGAVICLWGNHEALNAMGAFSYTSGDQEYEQSLAPRLDQCLQTQQWRLQYAATQEPARWAAYEPGGGLLVPPILSQLKVAVQVGQTVCVHAGLTAQHVREYGGIAGMNSQARRWVQNVSSPYNNLGQFSSMEELAQTVQQRARNIQDQVPHLLGGGPDADTSPVWMREYSSPHDRPVPSRAQNMMDAALSALRADRMVMGHTVQQQINAACHGKAWRVDVGASRGVMGGTPEVLEVQQVHGKEVVSVLTRGGRRIPGQQRQVEAPLPSRL